MPPDLPPGCAVAVVGAGPAGLAAAAALTARGVGRVVVLDREPEPGGIPRHCGHSPFGMREFHRLLGGAAYAARLAATARAAGAELFPRATVVGLLPGPRLALTTPEGAGELAAHRVVLATGAREASRAARLIGGDKPGGVLATGALQGLVYLGGARPFRRPVILGTELVAFSAILTCRHAGIRPVAMVEPGPRPVARGFAAALPRLMGIPLHYATDVVAVRGRDRVEAVVLEHAGERREVAADGLLVTGGFEPEASLVRASHLAWDPASGGPVVDQFGRCSDPDYFAAGNLLRPIETAGWSWDEGRRVAAAVAASLAGGLPDPAASLPLALDGGALRYVVPQRLAPGGGRLRLQLRVTRPVAGTLEIAAAGATLHRRRLASRPERRILVDLPRPPAAAATIRLAEAP